MTEEPKDLELPPLRDDLQLHEGAPSRDGTAVWTIQDPIAQRFFEVDAQLVSVLSLWNCGRSSGVDALMRARGDLPPDAAQWKSILEFFEINGLTRPVAGRSFARVKAAQPAKQGWWTRLIHNYLFFKVPLARPDAFLRRTLPFIEPLYSWVALVGWILAGLLGLHLVSRQWETFVGTFADLTNPAGMALFVASLAVVKALHELGHGYTAVREGSRVSTMGVAFMVMVPVLYTDTTDAWRLSSHRARVAIDVAGIAVELMIAVAATLAWCVLDDGLARYVAFALATSGWAMSLLVNLNPLMRFDGYYIFSDWLNLPNLQDRSFAMGRWWMRRTLWGWKMPQPEACGPRRAVFFVLFAFATWIYRLVLFLGIALLVYYFFFKALGIVLFLVEILWFIALPIWRELRAWHQQRGHFGARARWTAGLAMVALAAMLVPWSATIRVPAVMAAAEQAPAYAPRPARVTEILVSQGDAVRAGQALMRLEAPEIENALTRSREREAALRERIARAGSDAQDRAESLVLRRERQLEQERIAGLERDRERLTVRAPIDGRVVQLAPELHAGRWVDDKTNLAWIATPERLVARGYVQADEARRLLTGKEGSFRDDGITGLEATVQVERVGAAASRSMDVWLLASSFGGPIASRQARERPQSEQALIEVKAVASADTASWPVAEVRGEMLLSAKPISLAERAWRRVVQVWSRERSA